MANAEPGTEAGFNLRACRTFHKRQREANEAPTDCPDRIKNRGNHGGAVLRAQTRGTRINNGSVRQPRAGRTPLGRANYKWRKKARKHRVRGTYVEPPGGDYRTTMYNSYLDGQGKTGATGNRNTEKRAPPERRTSARVRARQPVVNRRSRRQVGLPPVEPDPAPRRTRRGPRPPAAQPQPLTFQRVRGGLGRRRPAPAAPAPAPAPAIAVRRPPTIDVPGNINAPAPRRYPDRVRNPSSRYIETM